ncbi:hypothetical protein FRB95_014432 [Tulasnella sp. JGI-2019a]|nr:hypothetical protein FRB95_014432 [Tulasnella sp. JGI-2019a]
MDSLAIELLHHIAFFAATSDDQSLVNDAHIQPPSSIVSLLCVCRAWNFSLNSRDHPHLYARIFRATFDSSSLYRRFPRHALSATPFTTELNRRWSCLKRIRYYASLNASQIGWHPRRYRRPAVLEDLMTIYLMLIENDGRNVRILKDFANVEEWLDRWRNWKMVKMHSETSRMPEDSEEVSLYWWVEWLLMTQDKCIEEPEDVRKQMIWLLTPYTLGTFKYPLSYAPWPYYQLPIASSFSPSSATHPPTNPNLNTALSPMHIVDHTLSHRAASTALSSPYFGSDLPIATPLLHHAATMLFLARKQAENHQGTINNVQFPGDTCDSKAWDLEWERLRGCRDPQNAVASTEVPGAMSTKNGGMMHVPGSLTGDWNGWFSIMTSANYESLMASTDNASPSQPDAQRSLNVLEDVWLLQDVQSWHVEEHHLRPEVLFQRHNEQSQSIIGGAGHPLNAHIPLDLEMLGKGRRVWSEVEMRWMDGIVVVRRGNKRDMNRREFFYETVRRGAPSQSHVPNHLFPTDGTPRILVTGIAIPCPTTASPATSLEPNAPPTYTSTQSRFMPAPFSKLIGTVRAWDGLVTLRASDGNGLNGSWVWNGYLSGSDAGRRDDGEMNGASDDTGNWVGQWRDGDMDIGRRAWEGVYVMRKRAGVA